MFYGASFVLFNNNNNNIIMSYFSRIFKGHPQDVNLLAGLSLGTMYSSAWEKIHTLKLI